jgi:hypothetical protein
MIPLKGFPFDKEENSIKYRHLSFFPYPACADQSDGIKEEGECE